jgi:2'-5' RNA ligase
MPRLFFALRPEPAQRAAIAAAMLPLVRALGAKPVAETDLHLTLAFLGEVAAEVASCLQRTAASIAPAPLHLLLSRVDCWEKSGVLCLLPQETAAAPAVQGLARTLVAAARAGGITLDDRPFRAHVTLARKVPPAASHARLWPLPLPASLPFTADGFVLMESTREPDGPRYKVIHAWPSAPGDV